MTTQATNSSNSSLRQFFIPFLVLVYIVINIFQIGGDFFVINLNFFIVLPLILTVTILAFAVWRQTKTGNSNRSLWLGLAIGWGMWAIAEFWWAIAATIGHEVPYPSWADFFWLLGYFPIYFAFSGRIHSLPKIRNTAQQISIWGISLFFIGFTTLFILIPIIQNGDPSAIVESVISLLYPIADIFLLIFVVRLLFSYQQGIYGQAWRWLAVGFILSSLGDLAFSYAVTADLYYPNQQANLLSTLGIDIPYSLSYLLYIFGLVLFQKLLRVFQPISWNDTKLVLVPNTHLLVFTKGNDKVIDVSKNYSQLFPNDAIEEKSISETLGISLNNENYILTEIKANGILQEETFNASTLFGVTPASISGIAVLNPQKEYSGAYLLVRIFSKDYSLDKLLTNHEKEMILSISSKTGTDQKEQEEIKYSLVDYYQTFLQMFYNRAFNEGGSIMADAFVNELQSRVRKENWQVEIQSNALIDANRLSVTETRKILPDLVETAKQFIVRLTDETTVNAIIRDMNSRYDKSALKNLSHFGLIAAEST